MTLDRTNILDEIVEHYLSSGDFNGTSVRILGCDTPASRAFVANLIQDRLVDMVRGDRHPNPHIKAFPAEPVADQLRKLDADGPEGCLYPTPELLADRKAGAAFADRYFSRKLSLGAAQLEFRVFDLRLLEWYRNDPRFEYSVDDIFGSIYFKEDPRSTEPRPSRDTLELARFGFAYNKMQDRAVALFLRDLHDLAPEHQTVMQGNLLAGRFGLHPDYFRSTIMGEFPERISVYDAVLEEKKHINAMCGLMGVPNLFRNAETRPRPAGFGILLRPTKTELHNFAMLLDKLLGDDINRAFFDGHIETTEILTDSEGEERKLPIGTITLMERYLNKRYKPAPGDGSVVPEITKALRDIRKVRQAPAHKLEDNVFDQKYVHEQRELITKAFDAVRTIRMIFENHRAVRGYEIPFYLREAKVWFL